MNNKTERYILSIVIATGVASIATQLVILREFLTLFSGNEFVIAITLFNWLILGGVGTLIARFLHTIIRPTTGLLTNLSVLLSLFGIAELLCIRILFKILFIHGQEAGFYETFLFTFFISSPYCILLGFLLPFSLYVIKSMSEEYSPVKVYMADNAGDALGGAFFSFVLVFLFTPVEAVILSSLPLIAVSLFAMSYFKQPKLLSFAYILLFSACIVSGLNFEKSSLERKNCNLVFYTETPYGRVEVQEYMGDFSLIRDGSPLFDVNNLEQSEQIVHYGLSQLDTVDSILFVSASSNVFSEAQKYQPQRIDYVEIDPDVAGAMFNYSFLQKSDNVFLIHDDPIKFLKENDTKFNAVIMDLPDPDTFGLNRFYSKEFFMTVKDHLSNNGVFVFSVQGFENYPEENLLKKLSSLYKTAGLCFEYIMILPFSQTYFVLSEKPLDSDIPKLLRAKGIETSYLKKFFIPSLVKLKTEKLKRMINTKAPVNSDFSPVIIKNAFGYWFVKYQSSPMLFGVCLSVILAVYLFFLSKSESILFFTGFSAMAVQIAGLFIFQILFGSIYLKTGMLITLFLAGLLAGAWIGEKSENINSIRCLFIPDILIILMLIIFVCAVYLVRYDLSQLFFFGFSFVFAGICGLQFSYGIKTEKDNSSRVSGFFAADLMGAGAGLLIFTLVLLPYLGIFYSVAALCCIKTLSLIRYKL